MNAEAVRALDAEPVETRQLPESPASVDRVRGAGWRLDDLWPPAVVLRERELRHNLDRLARWAGDHGVDLAPHGKTAMSPHLWSEQLERGAWAISAATAAQARVMHRYGVPRVMIANEVADRGALGWLAAALADPGFEPLVWADSAAGVELMEKHLVGAARPLPVLVELGVPGRRTGVRDVSEAVALARRVTESERLTLAGVAGYEGTLLQRRPAPPEVRKWLDRLADLAARVDAAGLFADAAEIVATGGGSAYPDLVAEAFAAMPALSRPVRRVVRPGAYVSHDDGVYERASPLRAGADADPLLPALSCHARVLSCPEPGRALIGVGKRDVAFDIDLPIVRSPSPAPSPARVTELNDHHGFLEGGSFEVGDVVELGLSHPCTVFDKWPLIPIVDSDGNVVDAIRTLF